MSARVHSPGRRDQRGSPWSYSVDAPVRRDAAEVPVFAPVFNGEARVEVIDDDPFSRRRRPVARSDPDERIARPGLRVAIDNLDPERHPIEGEIGLEQ